MKFRRRVYILSNGLAGIVVDDTRVSAGSATVLKRLDVITDRRHKLVIWYIDNMPRVFT